jgi:predicted alpha/beta hydrolase family esterase
MPKTRNARKPVPVAPPPAVHPKTTRPSAEVRRPPEPAVTVAQRMGRKLDAMPDRIDIRDWLYQPNLAPLPDVVVNCDEVPEILNQGNEGACTGFALAAVIQFHQHRRGIHRPRVSPRMLYEMARHYDEWPGESYEGSSARGAMQGWVAHGVCKRDSWPNTLHGPGNFTSDRANEARLLPGGAYYRVQHRSIRDMHAALADVGILYVTLMVHTGWNDPKSERRQAGAGRRLPTIRREGRATDGHAVAFVGYTRDGFIVQNSWGASWGADGFAILPYEDFLLHSTDVWVAQLGVPIGIDLWSSDRGADSTAGLQRAAPAIPLTDIRPYIVNVGNNGVLSDSGSYWTTDDDVARLFAQAIPDAATKWQKQRVMLYLHGGLNSEAEVAARVVAFRDVCLENEIYPLHLMWETGGGETLRGILEDYVTTAQERAAGWLQNFRDHLVEAKDRTFELTVSRPGTAMWDKMKENARLVSERDDERGVIQLLVAQASKALKSLTAANRANWELHIVAHSAGSIMAAYALAEVMRLGVALKSISFLAPAMTTALFKERMLRAIRSKKCVQPTVFVLSDEGERDDDVGPYGKSLLYLVSNSFEGQRYTPLLGMQKSLQRLPDQDPPDPDLARLFQTPVGGRPSLVVAGASVNGVIESKSESHGGFDNDEWTLNAVLTRILDHEPERKFTARDLQY